MGNHLHLIKTQEADIIYLMYFFFHSFNFFPMTISFIKYFTLFTSK